MISMIVACLYKDFAHRKILYFVSMPNQIKIQIHSDM